MRYNKMGDAVLRRLSKKSSFVDVYVTAAELGYDINSDNRERLSMVSKNNYGGKTVMVEDVTDWLNSEMELRGIIKEKEEV